MAVKAVVKGCYPLVLAGFLLASLGVPKTAAQTYSSLFRNEKPAAPTKKSSMPRPASLLRGVRLNTPFGSPAITESNVSSTAVYVQPDPPSPAHIPVQSRMDLLDRESFRAPIFDPGLASSNGAASPRPSAFSPRPLTEDQFDPYAPLGARRGSFIIYPFIESALGSNSNPTGSATNPRASGYTRLKPDITAISNWSNHELRLHIGAERRDYFVDDIEPGNDLDLSAKGRIDVRRDTQLELGAGFQKSDDASALTTSSLPSNASGRPDVSTFSANAALSQGLSRFKLRLSGDVASRNFGETPLPAGSALSNDERDVHDSVLALRSSYEWTEAVQPFVETAYNRHDYDIAIDPGGFEKGSDGFSQRAGALFNFGPLLSGEVGLGLLYQTPFEPTADSYTGFTFDGRLAWAPTPLTTVRLGARTAVLDDALVGAVGGLAHDATISLEHAMRRNLLLTGTLGLGSDTYEGIARDDIRLLAGLSAAWRVNRYAEVLTKLEHRSLYSSLPGEDAEATLAEIGLKLQY